MGSNSSKNVSGTTPVKPGIPWPVGIAFASRSSGVPASYPAPRDAASNEPWTGGYTSLVEVNLGAIARNLARLHPPTVAALAMVKGDAYGHGAVPVAFAAIQAGATWLGVSTVPEGQRLRAAGVDAPILVTTEPGPDVTEAALRAGLTCAVYTSAGIRRLSEAADRLGVKPAVHLKVNTGLNRAGAEPGEVEQLAQQIATSALTLQGLWTHFAKSDEPEDPLTRSQLIILLQKANQLGAAGMAPELVHCANTAAIMSLPETHQDMVRVGIGMYGVSPAGSLPGAGSLEPTLSWRTSVSMVREVATDTGVSYGHTQRVGAGSKLATVPVGFADGYPRALSNRSHVLIRGRRYPVTGLIAMDQMVVNCGLDDVRAGDPVVLIGADEDQVVTVTELADLAGTIVDEIFCGISRRVPRRYVTR